jgi:hypothetical protein
MAPNLCRSAVVADNAPASDHLDRVEEAAQAPDMGPPYVILSEEKCAMSVKRKAKRRKNRDKKQPTSFTMKHRVYGMRATAERLAKAGTGVEQINLDVHEAEHYVTDRILDPFDRLRRRLKPWQYRAGKNLQMLHDRGKVGPRVRVGVRFRVDGTRTELEADQVLHAKKEYQRRMDALGTIHRLVIERVVINGQDLSGYPSDFYSEPTKAVIEVLTILRTGLDLLDQFDGGRVRRRISGWAHENARPSALTSEQRAALHAEEEAMAKARKRQKKRRAA